MRNGKTYKRIRSDRTTGIERIDMCMEKLYVKWMQNEPIPEENND